MQQFHEVSKLQALYEELELPCHEVSTTSR